MHCALLRQTLIDRPRMKAEPLAPVTVVRPAAPQIGCYPALVMTFSSVSFLLCVIFYWPAVNMSKTDVALTDLFVGWLCATLGIVASSMVVICNKFGPCTLWILRLAIGFSLISMALNVAVLIIESQESTQPDAVGQVFYFGFATLFDVPLIFSLIMMHQAPFWSYQTMG